MTQMERYSKPFSQRKKEREDFKRQTEKESTYLVLYNIFQDLSNPWKSLDFLLHFTHMSQMCHILIILIIRQQRCLRYKAFNKNLLLHIQNIQASKSLKDGMVPTFLPWSSTWKSAIFLCTADNSRNTLIKSSPFEHAKLCNSSYISKWFQHNVRYFVY